MSIKNIIVTGGSSGIGEAISKKLFSERHHVLATGRAEKSAILPGESKNTLGEYYYFSGDLTKQNNIEELFIYVTNIFQGQLDVSVVNAGIGLPGTLLSSDESKWHDLYEINCLSAMSQMKKSAELMLNIDDDQSTDKPKDIIVISSVAASIVSEKNPIYGATKAAISSTAESLRKELYKSNIRVTVLEPGFVNSNFQERAKYNKEEFSAIEKEFGPLLQPLDIAEIVSFIISRPGHVNLSSVLVRPTHQKV